MTARQVHLHIGLPKSGTTYVQNMLWSSREALAEHGVLVPGVSDDAQRQAAWDLLGRRLPGVEQPQLPGSWQRLVDAAQAWEGDKVVISEEFLVHARPKHIKRIIREMAPAEVHVVVSVRDLERTICSMWQQELAMARTWTFDEYLAAVRDPETGPATAGVRFWLRFDLRRILETWSAFVPAERVHVVIVPRSGAPAEVLADRFSEAVSIDRSWLVLPERPNNTSVGIPATEVLRRLNVDLAGDLNQRQYAFLMEHVVRPVLRQFGGPQVPLPAGERGWIRERSTDLVSALDDGPYDVVGDPDELVPSAHSAPPGVATDAPEGEAETAPVDEAEMLEVALTALSATMQHYARYRTRQTRMADSQASVGTKVASSARALTFRTRFAVLESADHNRLASKAASLYLRRLSRRTPKS